MEDITQKYKSMKIMELKKYCKSQNIKKISKLNKQGIIDRIVEHLKKDTPQTNNIIKPVESSNKNIQIFNNDCMNELEKLPDNIIDCVITDPPYFIDKLDNKWSSKDVKEDVKNSHIKHLPKGMKFSKNQVKELYDYYLKLSKLLFNKMKPGAYFLSFSSPDIMLLL